VVEANENDNTFSKTLVVLSAAGAPPRLDGLTQQDGSFQFSLTGQTGHNYVIQVSFNLLDWINLTNVAGAQTPVVIRDPDATIHAQRFYRALLQ
jgi:hypothetical protein